MVSTKRLDGSKGENHAIGGTARAEVLLVAGDGVSGESQEGRIAGVDSM